MKTSKKLETLCERDALNLDLASKFTPELLEVTFGGHARIAWHTFVKKRS